MSQGNLHNSAYLTSPSGSPSSSSQVHRGPRLDSHSVALQLMVQIVESIATSQDAVATMTPAHFRILAEALEAAYTFCHAILAKMVSERMPMDNGIFYCLYNLATISFNIFYRASRDFGQYRIAFLLYLLEDSFYVERKQRRWQF